VNDEKKYRKGVMFVYGYFTGRQTDDVVANGPREQVKSQPCDRRPGMPTSSSSSSSTKTPQKLNNHPPRARPHSRPTNSPCEVD